MSANRGEPAVVFNATDMAAISSPFRFALVGKFSKGRLAMLDLCRFFSTLDLKDVVTVGLLDVKHFYRFGLKVSGMCMVVP